jgi:hypothetical protein
MKTIITSFIFIFSLQINAQYTINDVFSDTNETTTMTRDIFAVWWDNDFDYTAEADVLLDQMIAYKSICLNELNMENPPNPIDGFYFNVYLHDDGGFYDSNNWGNGIGTDSNGYPFFTLPYGSINDLVNLSHETFHIFQYNSNSSGFVYSGDSQWYIEATANWFAAIQNQLAPRALIEAEILVRIPQVPLWLSFENYPTSYPDNWQRYVHQYASALFMYYLTEEENISNDIIINGFYANTSQFPQEYLYNQIGSSNFRNHFIDWASHMTNNFDFITQQQKIENLNEWNTYADLSDDNEYVDIFDESGSNGWFRPMDTEVTNAWAFNTYKIENASNTNYTFEINGDPTGSYGDASFFQGKILVKNTKGNSVFYDVQMTNNYQGSLSIDITDSDNEIYFIIASMPEIFEDTNPEFQIFSYEMRIANNLLNVTDFNTNGLVKIYPNPAKDILNIEIDNYEDIMDLTIYSTTGKILLSKKTFNDQKLSIDVSNISEGLYFVRISSLTRSDTIKIIKK